MVILIVCSLECRGVNAVSNGSCRSNESERLRLILVREDENGGD